MTIELKVKHRFKVKWKYASLWGWEKEEDVEKEHWHGNLKGELKNPLLVAEFVAFDPVCIWWAICSLKKLSLAVKCLPRKIGNDPLKYSFISIGIPRL